MELRTISSGAQATVTSARTPAENMTGANTTTSSSAPPSQSAIQTINAVTQAANIPNMEQVKQAAHSVADSLKSMARGLEFEIHQDTQQIVVKIIDPETKEVIKQIPSEEVLRLAQSLDMATGRLIKASA